MPLGWERLNAKRTSPNKNIVFIKTLPGPDENTAKDFLERIAAQCLPIMNKHSLAVVSLEEYEPNREFLGRNFNNGEVIQLVLKSLSTSRWLPYKFVQMVMMHELAHIHQMNHSKKFWTLRNLYSSEMKALWEKGYTGDGLWGKGVLLKNGAFAHEELESGEDLPEHMCGGTFSSRYNRKRKAKPKITYKEQQERRIRRLFGSNGVALGADDKQKAILEKTKRPAGKPRVAGSVRGRELRAAAALDRFKTKKEEQQAKDEELVTDSEAESEAEEEHNIKMESTEAIDINGYPLLDLRSEAMVKVCEDEDENEEDAKEELSDFQGIGHTKAPNLACRSLETQPHQAPTSSKSKSTNSWTPSTSGTRRAATLKNDEDSKVLPEVMETGATACSVCSVENERDALTCIVCSNVLRPGFVPNSWRCKSLICKESKYINAGDVGLCGVCGKKKCSTAEC